MRFLIYFECFLVDFKFLYLNGVFGIVWKLVWKLNCKLLIKYDINFLFGWFLSYKCSMFMLIGVFIEFM